MKLTTKINLILAATFALGLSLVGINSYLLTEDNALQQVTDQADIGHFEYRRFCVLIDRYDRACILDSGQVLDST